jgi:hypothetical protein
MSFSLLFRSRFRTILGFMQHIGVFVLQDCASHGPELALRLAAEDARHTPSGPTLFLHTPTPTRLHALEIPVDYSELAISNSRHVKPAVHHHPATTLAVNMLFLPPILRTASGP